jgi:predicted component of type VI protein secretion system
MKKVKKEVATSDDFSPAEVGKKLSQLQRKLHLPS